MKRPAGLICETCARRELEDEDIHVFQLKLRDWLNVDRVELRPCLSVCPENGITIERRGKTKVLDQAEISKIKEMFDPTRQLSFISRIEESR